jgi:hypothetical protein
VILLAEQKFWLVNGATAAAYGQQRIRAHQVPINLTRSLTAFINSPHNQRLTAAAI